MSLLLSSLGVRTRKKASKCLGFVASLQTLAANALESLGISVRWVEVPIPGMGILS